MFSIDEMFNSKNTLFKSIRKNSLYLRCSELTLLLLPLITPYEHIILHGRVSLLVLHLYSNNSLLRFLFEVDDISVKEIKNMFINNSNKLKNVLHSNS